MTEDEALAELAEIAKTSDSARENAHEAGDALMAKALRELGWKRLADAYDHARNDWWYS